MTRNQQEIAEKLTLLGGSDEAQLIAWLASFPLIDGERTRTNLQLIDERLQDPQLLGGIFLLPSPPPTPMRRSTCWNVCLIPSIAKYCARYWPKLNPAGSC